MSAPNGTRLPLVVSVRDLRGTPPESTHHFHIENSLIRVSGTHSPAPWLRSEVSRWSPFHLWLEPTALTEFLLAATTSTYRNPQVHQASPYPSLKTSFATGSSQTSTFTSIDGKHPA
ncbi:hypothetical protein BDK51DRAFT_29180 [Blyttiomyces helicus]|uniref:Uncharacterized protein n=1 Tax=Blyttiomyces helicus TaxID=388810 RepID=A0A4P9W5S7_9FUNG|nr:hypothetical protein BDK51DRAFT_29180 [Blyttiomyces helicus]|eukprot:RKO86675.1 hypothetical protein BDK51DRAFT_29180 [Blyttiomyces helicus]